MSSLIQFVLKNKTYNNSVPKRTIYVVVLIGMVMLSGCIGIEDSIEGKYVLENNTDRFLRLDKEGTFLLQQDHIFEGKWRVEGDYVYLTTFFGSQKAKIENGALIDPDGDRWVKVD